jgi:hypothetical protein
MLRIAALLLVVGLSVWGCSKGTKGPTGPPPPPVGCSLNPASLAFDTLFAGQSQTKGFALTNVSNTVMSGTVRVTGPGFSVISDSTYYLGVQQSKAFTIRFAPTSSGRFTGTAATDCSSLPLGGVAVARSAVVSPDTLSFGRVAPGTSLSFTLRNTSAVTLSGDVASPCPSFTISGPSHYSLAPGALQSFAVVFQPTEGGPTSCAITTGVSAAVTCLGIGQQCNVSPTSLDLGTAWDHIDKTFTITNTDSFPLQGTVSSPCPAFAILGPASYNLAPGASQTFTVGLVNVSSGSQSCTINTGMATCSGVAVTGQTAIFDASQGGCAAPLESAVDFGTMTVGQTASHLLKVCGVGQCSPSTPYCTAFVLFQSNDLSVDGNTYSRICGITDCRQPTFSFTPHEVGVHHIWTQFWTSEDSPNSYIEGYVEFRATVVTGPATRR